MAVSSFAGSFALGTGIVGSTKVVTGVGFTPQAVLFWWSGLTALSSIVPGSHKFGAGFMVSATKRGGATSQSQGSSVNSACDHQTFDDAAIKLLTITGAVDGAADFSSFNADGFTLIIDDQFTADYRINFIAFGGTDLSADMASFSEPAATGSQAVTVGSGVNLASGRDDKAVLFLCSMGITGTNEGVNVTYTDSGWCIGAAAGDTPTNVCMGGGSQDGLPAAAGANTWSYCDDRYSIAPTWAGTPRARAGVSAWTSSGFTLTWAEVSGNTLPVVALVLYGASGADFRAAIVTGYSQTIANSTINLRPGVYSRGAVVASCGHMRDVLDTCGEQDARSLGAFSSTTARAYAAIVDGEPVVTNTEISLAQNTDEIYCDFLVSAFGIASAEGTMDAAYFGHTDVRFVMDDADSLPGFFWVLFVGQAQVGGVQPTIDVQMLLPDDPITAVQSVYGVTPSGWWRAEDLVSLYEDGEVVTSWPDASGNGRTLTLSGSTSGYLIKNASKFGNRAAVRTQGDNWTTGLPMSTFLDASGYGQIFVVYRADNVNAVQQRVIYSTNGRTYIIVNPSTPNIVAGSTDSGGLKTSTKTATMTPTAYQAHCGGWGHAATNELFIWCDDLDHGSAAITAGVGPMTAAALSDILQVVGGGVFVGEIAEVIVYNVFASQAVRRILLQYLALKYDRLGIWNATLPTIGARTSAGWSWRSVYSDVSGKEGMRFDYGMSGKDDDRVATSGSLQLSMRNLNSSGGVGYYSPGHPACRVGFDIGTQVRIAITYNGVTYYKWRGRITSVDTVAGKEDKVAHVVAADWMDEAARTKVRMIPVQTAQRADQLFTTLYGLIDNPPANVSIATTTDTYALSLDDTRDEAITVVTEFAKLAGSELGFIYVKRDTTQGETLVLESRTQRAAKQTNQWILDDHRLREFKANRARDDIKNHVKVSFHPRRLDPLATTTLFAIPVASPTTPSTLLYVAGALYPDFIFPYRDETQKGQRIGGTDMIAPVATTDYTANSAADGTGTDYTANFTVTVTFGGNCAVVNVVNAAGSRDAYLTKLQIRGKGVYSFENMLTEASDTPSINRYGENEMSFDMPYQNSLFVAADAAYYLLNRGTKARQRPEAATFLANRDPDAMTAALTLEPGDRIGVAESTIGVFSTSEPEGYFIAGCEWDLMTPGRIHVRYRLMPGDTEKFWILDKVGSSELDESAVLGFSIF